MKKEENKNEKKIEVKLDDEQIIKALGLESAAIDYNHNSNKNMSRFLLMLATFILFSIAALVFFRVLATKLKETQPISNSSNPLFNIQNDEIDNETPDIPNVTVYDALKDAEKLKKMSRIDAVRFKEKYKNVKNETLIQKRDKFAMEKLKLLQSIEKGKDKKE